MSGRYPEIVYTEEGMREGMQIKDSHIPIDAKVALLDALSEIGLKRIVVGSFVRPRYTPQMARMDDINVPFVETLEQATHFKRGPETYAEGIYPWKEPITSPYRERVEQGLRLWRWTATGRGAQIFSPSRLQARRLTPCSRERTHACDADE